MNRVAAEKLVDSIFERNDAAWDEVAADPDRCREALHLLKDKYAAICHEFAKKDSELKAFQQQCHAMGEAGKSLYFARVGEHEEWRQRGLFFKRSIEQRLSFIKAASQRHADEKHAWKRVAIGLANEIRRHRESAPSRVSARDQSLYRALEMHMPARPSPMNESQEGF